MKETISKVSFSFFRYSKRCRGQFTVQLLSFYICQSDNGQNEKKEKKKVPTDDVQRAKA